MLLWWVNNIEVTLYHAHKLLTTILSLTNYCQEVFRPRLKFPGWGFFPGWALAHPAHPVPAPMVNYITGTRKSGNSRILWYLTFWPQIRILIQIQVTINPDRDLHRHQNINWSTPHISKNSPKSLHNLPRDAAKTSVQMSCKSQHESIRSPNRHKTMDDQKLTCHVLFICQVWWWQVQWFLCYCVDIHTHTHTRTEPLNALLAPAITTEL